MAAAPAYLTIEQFEQLYSGQKPYFEYWFGEAHQKSVPTKLHSRLQFIIAMLLDQLGWSSGPEQELWISAVARPVPDIVASHIDYEAPYPTKPVDLCVEILSPDDRLRDVFTKCAHYVDWGIGHAWIVDGENRKAYIMSIDHPAPVETGLDGELIAGSEQNRIAIPLAKVFEEFDRRANREHQASR